MAKRVLIPWDDEDGYMNVWKPKLWLSELTYDKNTGDFSYTVNHINDGRKIVVLEGNGSRYKQDERNRARRFAWRLEDALNACGV